MKKTMIAAIAVVSLLSSSLIVSAAPSENSKGKSMNSNRAPKEKTIKANNGIGKDVSAIAKAKAWETHPSEIVCENATTETYIDESTGQSVTETECSKGEKISEQRRMNVKVTEMLNERVKKNVGKTNTSSDDESETD